MGKRRLDSLKNCRVYLAATVNGMDAGQISESAGKARAYMIKILGELIQTSDIEARLIALETKMKGLSK